MKKILLMLFALAVISVACGGDRPDGPPTGSTDTDTDRGTVAESVVDVDLASEVVQNANWGSGVTLTVNDSTFRVEGNGIPDHELQEIYVGLDPQTGETWTLELEESDIDLEITLSPAYAENKVDTELGTIGVMVSGGLIFNDYEDPERTSRAVDDIDTYAIGDIKFLDVCNGHPLNDATTYHYHGIPYCITDVLDTEGEHSVLVGYLMDGFPAYGPQDNGGEAPTDLDECNGHEGATPEFPDGIYHYHFSETAPYTMDCYHGDL